MIIDVQITSIEIVKHSSVTTDLILHSEPGESVTVRMRAERESVFDDLEQSIPEDVYDNVDNAVDALQRVISEAEEVGGWLDDIKAAINN